MNKLLQDVLQYYGDDGFDPSLFYSNSGSGMSQKVEALSEVLNPNCHYHNHPIGWKLFLAFNFVVMFIIPFFVSF